MSHDFIPPVPEMPTKKITSFYFAKTMRRREAKANTTEVS